MNIAEELREIAIAEHEKSVAEFRSSAKYRELIELARDDAKKGATARSFSYYLVEDYHSGIITDAFNQDGFEVMAGTEYFRISWYK